MATVQSVIDSARYDLVDYVDGIGIGIEFDDTELLNYLNRMVKLLDTNLSAMNSDLVEAKCQYINPTTGQSYLDLSSDLNSGNWLTVRSVWLGSTQMTKKNLGFIRRSSMFRSGNANPTEWTLSGRQILFPHGTAAVTDLADGYASTDWTNVDINSYDETTDLTITANAAAQYCTLPILSAPTTVGTKYRIQITAANVVSGWYLTDFTGAQTFGTITESGTHAFVFVAEYTGGCRLVSTSSSASGDFTAVKLHTFEDTITIYYDKKTADLEGKIDIF